MTSSSLSARLAFYTTALQSFTSSPSAFRILASVPPRPSQTSPPPKHLYILDSSFNPPTLAHLRIAQSALQHDHHPSVAADKSNSSKRLLLLLATQNADKAAKPAAFEQRLVMMEIFARGLLEKIRTAEKKDDGFGSDEGSNEIEGIDIAVTTKPYFVDKANAIAEEEGYTDASTTQIHLTGFDTLIRILNPKYYPPTHTLQSLQPFLAKHRLRVTYRTEPTGSSSPDASSTPSYDTIKSQDQYLQAIESGSREKEGALPSWVQDGRIVVVEGRREGEEVISSTKVREAVKNDDREALRHLVTDGIAEYILKEKFYLES